MSPLPAVIRLLLPAVGATPVMPVMSTVIVPAVVATPELVIADWLAVPANAVPIVLPPAKVSLPVPRVNAPAAVGS